MDAIRTCWTGDIRFPAFQSILTEPDEVFSIVPPSLLESGQLQPSPHVIVLAQSRRGQFRQDLVEKIWTHYPLAAIVNLLSSECEGDIRAGKALRGVVRVFWYDWPHEWPRVRRQWLDNGCTHWHHPRTASVADRLTVGTMRTEPTTFGLPPESIRVAILAPGGEAAGALCDAVQMAGCVPVRYELNCGKSGGTAGRTRVRRDGTGPRSTGEFESAMTPSPSSGQAATSDSIAAVCIDATALDDGFTGLLDAAKSTFPGVPVLATIGFPRPQDLVNLRAEGVASVVAKPFVAETFATALFQLVRSTSSGDGASEQVA